MMVRITTTLRIILCGILLTAALSGCCQAVPVPTRSITLRFGYFTFLSSNSAVNDAVTKGFQDAADAYTAEHPNVTVELVPLNFGSLESLSAADFDLVLLPSVFMGRLAEAGEVATLKPGWSWTLKPGRRIIPPACWRPFSAAASSGQSPGSSTR
ncbi:MAG: hypothetical protein GXY52_00585 [Chloroflexi bacterium]|nr:hypothetical protein [Chloroflexota bacterium]